MQLHLLAGDDPLNILAADTRRQCADNAQTIHYYWAGDPLDFARDRLAQAKASCLSGTSVDIILLQRD
jgi:hypothetical protein